jgi:hypothetical protein
MYILASPFINVARSEVKSCISSIFSLSTKRIRNVSSSGLLPATIEPAVLRTMWKISRTEPELSTSTP